jgi:hypothetical protein
MNMAAPGAYQSLDHSPAAPADADRANRQPWAGNSSPLHATSTLSSQAHDNRRAPHDNATKRLPHYQPTSTPPFPKALLICDTTNEDK